MCLARFFDDFRTILQKGNPLWWYKRSICLMIQLIGNYASWFIWFGNREAKKIIYLLVIYIWYSKFYLHCSQLFPIVDSSCIWYHFLVCRYWISCYIHKFGCWELLWMEIYCNVCYNKAFIFCGILCLHHFQFSPSLLFCIHSHKLCSSSCWIWYSRDQRLFKW